MRGIPLRVQVSQVFVSKLRKAASDNGYQMKPRKVKRGNTVYEMQARTKNRDGKMTFSSPELAPIPIE
jgi:hypothetical protein